MQLNARSLYFSKRPILKAPSVKVTFKATSLVLSGGAYNVVVIVHNITLQSELYQVIWRFKEIIDR